MLVGFIGLFLLMHEIGQARNYHLRVLNGVLHIGLLFVAIREYRKKYPNQYSNYVSGVTLGLLASAIGAIGFAAFVGIYLSADTEFMSYIQNSIEIGKYFTPFTTSLFLVVEGIAVGLIGSYIITRVTDAAYAEPEAWERYRR